MLDIIQRYVPVLERLESRLRPDSKILEVGCGFGGISIYVSDHEVVGCDLDLLKANLPYNLRPVECSATSLPFADRSFDFTVSVDVIEHIFPPAERWRALDEMLRVTSKELVLAVPSGPRSVEYVERFANFCRKRYSDYDSRWIDEHVEYGHPTEQEIIDQVKRIRPSCRVQVVNNANGPLWLLMMKVLVVMNEKHPGLVKRLDLSVDFESMKRSMRKYKSIFRLMNFGHTIRKVFFISMDTDKSG